SANARPMVGDGEADPTSIESCRNLDLRAGLVAAVAHRVADQIVEQLDELCTVATYRGKAFGEIQHEVALPPAAQAAGVGERGLDDIIEGDAFARRQEAVGLYPRQAHQILDDAQHAPRLVANGTAEIGAQLGRK